MARPIKETPILFGEDARRFRQRMSQKRNESAEERADRLEAYNVLKVALEVGEENKRKGIVPPCIVTLDDDN